METLFQGYDAWAATYDRDVRELGYRTHEHVADAVSRHIENRGACMLDVGAGTGLLGEALHRRGYRHLTGMDASHGMLAQAARKGIYRLLCRMMLGGPLGFASRSFDGLVAAGVFSAGHAPPLSLTAFEHVVRSGGWVVFSLKWDGNYKDDFLAAIQQMEEKGCWQPYAASAIYPSWPHADPGMQARVLVYKVL